MHTVIGYKNVDFKSKEGSAIKGTSLYTTIDGDAGNNITGKGCESFFLSAERFPEFKPAIGSRLDVRYNKFGKVESVTRVNA